MTESFWYPSVEDVLTIHQDIVSAYPETSSGVQNPGDIEFALAFSSGETSGREPTLDPWQGVPSPPATGGEPSVR